MSASSPPPLLQEQDAMQVLQLGRRLAGSGVINQGQVQGGLLKAVLADGEAQTSAQATAAAAASASSMSKSEFSEYLQFMGKRLGSAGEVIGQDHESANPEHTQEIAKAAAKTAEFVRDLSEKKEQDIVLKEQMQVEIQRAQLEAYQQDQKKEQEKDQKKEGFGLGTQIGGILDEMVKVLGEPFKDSTNSLKAEVEKAAVGLQGCAQSDALYNDKSTPASARPVKESTMPLPE